MSVENLGWTSEKGALFVSTGCVFLFSCVFLQLAGSLFCLNLPLAIGFSALNVVLAARAARWCEGLSAWGFPLKHEKWTQERRFICGATWFFQLPFWAVGASFNRMVTSLFNDDGDSGVV